MTPAAIRAIVNALPITAAQLDAVIGVSPGSVSRWQTGKVTPTAPVLRLLEAYQAGYRPTNWPNEVEKAMTDRSDQRCEDCQRHDGMYKCLMPVPSWALPAPARVYGPDGAGCQTFMPYPAMDEGET